MLSDEPKPVFLTRFNTVLLFLFTLLSSYGTTTLYSSSFFVLVPDYNLSLSFATAIAYLTVLISIYLTVAVGYYGDRIVSRYGQRKPLVLVGYIIVCVAFILMAHLSANLSQLGDPSYTTYTADDDTKQDLMKNEKEVEVWFAVFQIIAAIGMGLFLIPYQSWFIESTKDSEEYNRIQLIIFNLATGAGSVLALYALYTIPSKALTISAISYISGLPLLCILCYTLHNEKVRDSPSNKAQPILPSLRILWNSHSEFRSLFYNKIILSTGEGIGTEFASFVPYILFPSITHYKKLLFLGTVFFYGSYTLGALFTLILKFLIAKPLHHNGKESDGISISGTRPGSPDRSSHDDHIDKRGEGVGIERGGGKGLWANCGGPGWDKLTLYRYIIVIFVVVCVIEFGITVPSMIQTERGTSSDVLSADTSMDLIYVYMSLQVVLSALFATAGSINDLMVRDLVNLDIFVYGKNRANMYQSALSVPPRILVALLLSLPQVIFYSSGYTVVDRPVEDDPSAYDDLIENKYHWTEASFYEIIFFQNILAAGLAVLSYVVLRDYTLTQPVADRLESALKGRDALLERQEVASVMGSMSAVVNVDPGGHPGEPGYVHDNNPFGSMMVDRERVSVLKKVRSRSRGLPFMALRGVAAFPLSSSIGSNGSNGNGGRVEDILEEVADMMVMHLSKKELVYILYYWSGGKLISASNGSSVGLDNDGEIDIYTVLPPSVLHSHDGRPGSVSGDLKANTRNILSACTHPGGPLGGGNRKRTETEETGEWVEAAAGLEEGALPGHSSNHTSSSSLTSSAGTGLLPPPPPVGGSSTLPVLFFSRLSSINAIGLFVIAPLVSVLLLVSMVVQIQESSMYTPLVTNLMCLSTGYVFYESLRYTNIQGMSAFIKEHSKGWEHQTGRGYTPPQLLPSGGDDTDPGEVVNALQEGLSGIILEPLKDAVGENRGARGDSLKDSIGTSNGDNGDAEGKDGTGTGSGFIASNGSRDSLEIEAGLEKGDRAYRVDSRAMTVDRSKQESIQIFQSIQLAMEGAMGESKGAMGAAGVRSGSSYGSMDTGLVTLDMERDSDFGLPLGLYTSTDTANGGNGGNGGKGRPRAHTGLSSLSATSHTGGTYPVGSVSSPSSARLHQFYTLLWQCYHRHIREQATSLTELVAGGMISSSYIPNQRKGWGRTGGKESTGNTTSSGNGRDGEREWYHTLMECEYSFLPAWLRGYALIYSFMATLLVVAMIFIFVVV